MTQPKTAGSDRTILHIDANSFFASVESSEDPSLRGLPFAVCGDASARRGVILASSYEAKAKYGIKTGEPVIHALKKYPSLHLISAHHHKYMEYSRRLHDIFNQYSDLVEAFSCDEAWIDVTGCRRLFGTGMEIAEQIRRRVKEELGLTVSIGVSFNKTIAKIGSDYKKPDAVTEITRGNFEKIVWPLPVGALIYAGRSTVARLNAHGVFTIGDLAQMDPRLVQAWLGKTGLALYDQARGRDDSPVSPAGTRREIKSIGNSTTLKRDLENDEEVRAVLMKLSLQVAKRARAKGMAGKVVGISIRDDQLSVISRQRTLERYTDLSSDILAAAMELFQEAYRWKRPIRSLGVRLEQVSAGRCCDQLSLLEDETAREKEARLEQVYENLETRFGGHCVTKGLLMKNKEVL